MRVVVATLGALAWALVVVTPVAGHAELVATSPAANASLAAAPDTLSLTFSEPIDRASASLRLVTEDHAAVAGLGVPSLDAAGTTLSVSLPPLEAGVYTASYRVTSAVDGHVSLGLWAFLVDPSGTRAPPTLASTSSTPSGDAPQVATRWLALAAALVVAGTVLLWLVSVRPARTPPLPTPWIWIALAGYLAFLGLATYLSLAARPLLEGAGGHAAHAGGGIVPLDFAAPFGATPFATAMRVALVGTAAAALMATMRYFAHDEARRRGRRAPGGDQGWLLATAAAAVVALGGFSLGGHAAAMGGIGFAAIDWFHLLAAAAWLGPLPGLLLLVPRRAAADGTPGLLRAVLTRHSRVAMATAPLVALTGIASSSLVVGEARGLIDSSYGNQLLAKALLFSVAIGIGAANFFLVRAGAVRRLLVTAAVEVAIGALAVVAAASLVTGLPAAGRQPQSVPSAIGAAQLTATAGESRVQLAVNLPAPGDQRYQVAVRNATSGAYRTDVQKVFIGFTPPAGSDLPGQRVELHPTDLPWLWGTAGAYTPIVGDWELEVIVRRAGIRDETASVPLEVAPLPQPTVVPPPATGLEVPAPLGAAWDLLPRGSGGWLLLIGVLGAAVVAAGVERLGRGGRALRGLRLALVTGAVSIGLLVGSRAVVEIADAPPAVASAASNPTAPDERSLAAGARLYAANCSVCHGPSGAGDGPRAAELVTRPRPLWELLAEQSDGALAWRIAVGTATTRMPGFATTLSPDDRWDLVNYLRTLDGG